MLIILTRIYSLGDSDTIRYYVYCFYKLLYVYPTII